MAFDINPALRAELNAQLDVINPVIRGLHDIVNDPLPVETLTVVTATIAAYEERRDLIQRELNAMDNANGAMEALTADGYPDLPPVVVTPEVFDSLQAEETDIDAAMAIFVEQPVATGGTITVPPPTPKPPT